VRSNYLKFSKGLREGAPGLRNYVRVRRASRSPAAQRITANITQTFLALSFQIR
jgi:hypothetical protein